MNCTVFTTPIPVKPNKCTVMTVSINGNKSVGSFCSALRSITVLHYANTLWVGVTQTYFSVPTIKSLYALQMKRHT